MKKIVVVLILFCGYTFSSYAQQNKDTLYVIFTSLISDEDLGVEHFSLDNNNPSAFRHAPKHFIVHSKGIYIFSFEYKNYTDEPDNPVIVKPVSFIEDNRDSSNWYDWDELKNTVKTREDAKQYVDKFLASKILYFIDRNEISNGKCYLIPVTKYGRRQYSATVLE